jgi:cytochrome c
MKLDSFEVNKMAAAGLLALLIGMVSAKVADILVEPVKITKSVYIVEGVEQMASSGSVPATATGPEPIEPLLASADIERGKVVAKKCAQCHTFNKGEPNKIGPNLYGIVGEKVGEVTGYVFSKAITSLGGIWTVQRLNEYLFKPAAYAKGTKMSFAGLSKGQERADVIAYLNSLSDSPQPLPVAVAAAPAPAPAPGAAPAAPAASAPGASPAAAPTPAPGVAPAAGTPPAKAEAPSESPSAAPAAPKDAPAAPKADELQKNSANKS